MAIWKLIPDYQNEIFHVASDERVSLYQFGMTIARLWGYDGAEHIRPIASSELKGIAPRPRDTQYDLTKLHEAGITLPGIEEGLKALR
jgi:dTDP-4-dehydrorhamnose reductase